MWMLLLACSLEQAAVEVVAANPMGTIDRDVDATPWEGTVEEVRDGGYAYQRVDGVWTVSLGSPSSVGSRVEVRPVGVARDFCSRRTGDVYDELWFAVVKEKP